MTLRMPHAPKIKSDLGYNTRVLEPHDVNMIESIRIYKGQSEIPSYSNFKINGEEVKMRFEIGKFYGHTTGHKLYICGMGETQLWGRGLIAEDNNGTLSVVGSDESSAENYKEITEEEFINSYCDKTPNNHDGMVFELGKCYVHETGDRLFICGLADPFSYGKGFIAENNKGEFSRVGDLVENTIGWKEITKKEFIDASDIMHEEVKEYKDIE